jgi:hypothetical protein
MQSFYAEQFEREMGCTEAEWLSWLPRAIGEHAWERQAHSVTARLGAGQLRLHWRALEPRRLGLVQLPRLLMRFEFSNLEEAARHTFMKRFDLYTQRGGG